MAVRPGGERPGPPAPAEGPGGRGEGIVAAQPAGRPEAGSVSGALAGQPGFRLVYRKGAPFDLAKRKPDLLEDLVRPERYRARPDINLSKYIRPDPLRPQTGIPEGGVRGAAAAARGGAVAAVAATPAGGVNVPDNIRRYDFSPWANEVVGRIQMAWSLLPYGGGTWNGEVGVLVMVSKAGELLSAEIKVSSNVDLLDRVALAALRSAAPLPALPEDFPNSSLEMYLLFKYGH